MEQVLNWGWQVADLYIFRVFRLSKFPHSLIQCDYFTIIIYSIKLLGYSDLVSPTLGPAYEDLGGRERCGAGYLIRRPGKIETIVLVAIRFDS
jgi:hypothetical protein